MPSVLEGQPRNTQMRGARGVDASCEDETYSQQSTLPFELNEVLQPRYPDNCTVVAELLSSPRLGAVSSLATNNCASDPSHLCISQLQLPRVIGPCARSPPGYRLNSRPQLPGISCAHSLHSPFCSPPRLSPPKRGCRHGRGPAPCGRASSASPARRAVYRPYLRLPGKAAM